ncbi:omega-amidase NIT2-like isoform X2 [Neodiprion pinetum]|uniref:omega-amidase NIT2-like isoform X2 n=1 Tax=Neodiprion pinetum TaxID=441929 RepID=UPI001EE14EB5|nr:omega-amidase NIT2-like isoform X1 [Neodiprion pinetum]XP_046478468.1 omega-amidase NIT2-like isoform X1 [Neodiprion pinetum]
MTTLRLALVQLAVTDDKAINISRAISFVEQAKQRGADVVALPECFNSPYGTVHFRNFAENIPAGETSLALSAAAKTNEICVIGGSIPERDGEQLFNTCTVWDSNGTFIGKYRKMHLFDVDVEGKISFKESDTITAGNELLTFRVKGWKIGLGICHDIRFEELARLYRNLGCQLMFYPGAFESTVTGPLHWSLLQRARANDAQLYVAGVSSAKVDGFGYESYGHTQLTDPWGRVLKELEFAEDMIVADIDMTVVDEVRTQIPIFGQRREDLYETAWIKN